MKSNAKEWENIQSDQKKKMAQPPLEKPYDEDDKLIELPKISEKVLTKRDITNIFEDRKSYRKYTEKSLSLEELLDFNKCRQAARRIAKETIGIESSFCGRCMTACPYTIRYIDRMKEIIDDCVERV